MKRTSFLVWLISILLSICLFVPLTVSVEGILPGLSETVGIGMPSLGEALQRYPVTETENEDGSIAESFMNVSETDFNKFSVYLESEGAMLADYQVENGLLTAEIQVKGASFQLSYDSRSGEAKVIYPSGTFDEWTKNAKVHFDAGQKLLEEGKTDEALVEILAIPQYSEYDSVVNLLHSNDNLAAAAREAKLVPYRTIDNIVNFGRYEQDDNTVNGLEAIKWIVLDYNEKEHKALLLSKYGLDAKPYNTEHVDITWEECTLRNWLNGEFVQTAFSVEEQAAILTSAVDNGDSQGYYSMNGGNNTQDRIFLLSYAEAKRYLNAISDESRDIKARVAPTAYAITQGAYVSSDYQTADGEPVGWWWLRSPGFCQDDAAGVYSKGAVSHSDVNSDRCVVRPAFWLNLKSDIF